MGFSGCQSSTGERGEGKLIDFAHALTRFESAAASLRLVLPVIALATILALTASAAALKAREKRG
jgi:hypothetical protein